jgi:aminobenzoyl-glutamate transport protein
MSAKDAFVSPVFVPMFMTGAGISPEPGSPIAMYRDWGPLTQAAYRVADSCTNAITPVNAYLIIILAVLRRYIPGARLSPSREFPPSTNGAPCTR